MTLSHPHRYPTAFRGQLERLERLSPGITQSSTVGKPDHRWLNIEHTGASAEELLRRRQRCRHLESLIADWKIDGETVFQAGPSEASAGDALIALEFPDVPPTVSFVEFEANPLLALSSQRGSRIEGVYMREIIIGGAFSIELTFVCDEPGWRTLETCLFADAMEVGSRIFVATLPLGREISLSDATNLFSEFDHRLLDEPALRHALASAAAFTANHLTNAFGF